MIKFFRKIRQNLLSEGKTGKYFKYAFGEIVLVVIGILIALSLNNWNEKRKSNNLLKIYEANIITELNQDLFDLNKADSLVDVRMKSIDNYFEYYNSESANMDTLVKKRNSSQLFFVLFQTNTFSLEDLITSGNLQLFTLEEKNSFLKYKKALKEYENFQSIGIELTKHKYNEFESDIDKMKLIGNSTKELASVNNWGKYDINSHQFRKLNNYIVTFLEFFQGQKQYLKRLEEKTEELKIKLENK
ncbi:DUF6090 family protein [Mangrovimonas sp. ST2L15]|uniref:DUF6090 family protein n=1 Tax=Mangrovimonas sp. ST2L15 TaxID=1645916 RepID=UPI0006B61D26|nr:DUF6090 family protein [Mangrovimonas sp. ST2L15]